MTSQYEWAHVSNGVRLVGPDELHELAPVGNDDRDWGLEFSTGSNGCMIYGPLQDLIKLAENIHQQIEQAVLSPVEDPVDHPTHYTAYKGVEVIDLTEQMNFNRGNAVKYVARAGLKDPAKEIEDLRKASWYLTREIKRLEKGRDKS